MVIVATHGVAMFIVVVNNEVNSGACEFMSLPAVGRNMCIRPLNSDDGDQVDHNQSPPGGGSLNMRQAIVALIIV